MKANTKFDKQLDALQDALLEDETLLVSWSTAFDAAYLTAEADCKNKHRTSTAKLLPKATATAKEIDGRTASWEFKDSPEYISEQLSRVLKQFGVAVECVENDFGDMEFRFAAGNLTVAQVS